MKIHVITAVGLPQASETGLHAQPSPLPYFIFFDFFRHRRPWPNKRHLSLQYIEKLRQFIQAGPAQEPPEFCHPGVVAHLEYRPVHLVKTVECLFFLVSPVYHGPELIHYELPAVQSAADLFEYGWPRTYSLYDNRKRHKKREQENYACQ